MSASAVTRIAIGMDVGSTTVKAVVVDTETRAVLAPRASRPRSGKAHRRLAPH